MKKYISLLIILLISLNGLAQNTDRSKLTRETVLEMSIEDLADLDLEALMTAMDLLGVSSMEELIELLINRNVYSASGHDESTMVSPLSSSVLTRDEIREYGATTFEEALRLIPGVLVRQKTNGNFDVHLRGLDNIPTNNMMLYSENTNTLLMIDGRPMFNYAHGAIVWESLPIGFEDIERIEVVRGPASALYGSNAVNGVINIITSRISDDSPLVSGSVQGGSLSTYLADVGVRRQFTSKLSAGLTANYQSRDRVTDEAYFFNLGDMYRRVGEEQIPFSGGFLPFSEYANLSQLNNGQYFDLETDGATFPNPERGRENKGVNAYLQYLFNKGSEVIVSGGYQDSYSNTSLVGDLPRSISGRESSTGYINIMANISNLKMQANYTGGVQDFARGEYGYVVDMGQYNASAEYDINISDLLVRPGVSYQSVFYDDSPYLEAGRNSYLNGKKELNTLGLSLRLDYALFEKLRLISALRAEKYNNPDDWYASWQFAGVLPINENNTVRAVYSRANRSSFIVNAHSDFTWDRAGRVPPSFIYFNGNPNAQLMYSDMVELGYRIRPNKRILLDMELFTSKSKNFGALMPDRSTLDFSGLLTGTASAPISEVFISYLNIPVEARQTGFSLNFDWIISEKIITKLHGTFQQTKLDNYSELNRNEITQIQLGGPVNEVIMSYQNPEINSIPTLLGAIMTEQVAPVPELFAPLESNWQPTEFEDGVKHKNTPSFWGMAGIIYRPTQKWNIASDAYFYGSQTYQSINGSVDIDGKLILNSKISYKATNNLNVFINARNLINDDKPEFGFMDNIGALYLAGIQFTF